MKGTVFLLMMAASFQALSLTVDHGPTVPVNTIILKTAPNCTDKQAIDEAKALGWTIASHVMDGKFAATNPTYSPQIRNYNSDFLNPHSELEALKAAISQIFAGSSCVDFVSIDFNLQRSEYLSPSIGGMDAI